MQYWGILGIKEGHAGEKEKQTHVGMEEHVRRNQIEACSLGELKADEVSSEHI